MFDAGIDVTKFHPHSTRSASASAADSKFIPIDEIMHLARWKSADSFSKYYCKFIEHMEPPTRFFLNQKQKAQKKTINNLFSKYAKIKETQASKTHSIHNTAKYVNTRNRKLVSKNYSLGLPHSQWLT